LTKCTLSDFDLEVAPNTIIKVFVIRPIDLPKNKNTCEIHAHGGGACLLNAEMFNGLMAEHAVMKKCIIFNVDYRKGPETKCPGGQEDFAKAIEYVYNNDENFGIDKTKICASGVSGGGWICLGACILLAKANKVHMVKAQFLWTPMISNECSRTPKEDIHSYELGVDGLTPMFRLLGTDHDNQLEDEQLFPGRCSDEILKKLPPIAIFTSEMDMLRRDCFALKERCMKHGKLLDINDIPGCMHANMGENPESEGYKYFFDCQFKGFEAWIKN